MINLYSRQIIQSVVLLCSLQMILSCENSPTETLPKTTGTVSTKANVSMLTATPTRLNISTVANDPEMLNMLRKATATMRANSVKDPASTEFPTSLQFWANTHGYFGAKDDPHATSFKKTVEYRGPQCINYFKNDPYNLSDSDAKKTCRQFIDEVDRQFTPDRFSSDVWGTCQHTTEATTRDPRFLPWHRLYLYYYERTLRKYAGDQRFALPYWDYFDYQTADGKGLYLPPVIAEKDNNPLYDDIRTLWLNENKVTMEPQFANAEDAFQEPDFVSFSNRLENTPHGMMHCAVGNGCTTAHMGWVPVAGNDPIFYMHHANIDRLWQCWLNQKANGETIDLAWAKANLGLPESWYDIAYQFVDENGNKVTKTIADAFSPEVLAISYAGYENCPDIKQHAPKMINMVKSSVGENVIGKDKAFSLFQIEGVELHAKAISIGVENKSNLLKSNNTMMKDTENLSSGTYLLLDNIVVNRLPSFTYGVYLSSKSAPEKRELVTLFNFFGFGDHGSHGGGHHSDTSSLGSQRHYIEDDLAALDIQSLDDILVHFVPMNSVSGKVIDKNIESPIFIEKISIITIP